MHRGVFNWWQINFVTILSVKQLNFGWLRRRSFHLSKVASIGFAHFDSLLRKSFFVDSKQFFLIFIALWIWLVVLLFKKNFSPKRVLPYLQLLFRFEQSLSRHLFLSLLLTTSNDTRSFLLDFLYNALESVYEIWPVLIGYCAAYFVSSRMVGQVQCHVLQVVWLVFVVEFFP